MEYLIQQLINALALGGTYALLALGLAVVFSILGLINFAHDELMTITGYALFFAVLSGLSFPVAIVIALLTATVCEVLMERVAFRPVRKSSGTIMLLTSFVQPSVSSACVWIVLYSWQLIQELFMMISPFGGS